MDEVRAGAATQGREIPAAFVDEMIATTEAMTPYAPSMRLDFDAGRPLETGAIYAAPLAVARAAGVALPETAALLEELQRLTLA
jgi:2-dehydropantoate 2-reductase